MIKNYLKIFMILTTFLIFFNFQNVSAKTLEQLESKESLFQDFVDNYTFDPNYTDYYITYDLDSNLFFVYEYNSSNVSLMYNVMYDKWGNFNIQSGLMNISSSISPIKLSYYQNDNLIYSNTTQGLVNEVNLFSSGLYFYSSSNDDWFNNDNWFLYGSSVYTGLISSSQPIIFNNLYNPDPDNYTFQAPIYSSAFDTTFNLNDIIYSTQPQNVDLLDTFDYVIPPIDSIGFMVSKKDNNSVFPTIYLPTHSVFRQNFITSFIYNSTNNGVPQYDISQGFRNFNIVEYIDNNKMRSYNFFKYQPFNDIEYFEFKDKITSSSDINKIYITDLDLINFVWIYENVPISIYEPKYDDFVNLNGLTKTDFSKNLDPLEKQFQDFIFDDSLKDTFNNDIDFFSNFSSYITQVFFANAILTSITLILVSLFVIKLVVNSFF